jgi:hypothetical protein
MTEPLDANGQSEQAIVAPIRRKVSTQRTLGSMALAFEAFVIFFATLVAFGLKLADPALVWSFGLGMSVFSILLPAVLGKPGGYQLGWALQALALGLSISLTIANPAGWVCIIISVMFVGLWGWAMIAGYTIDKARTAFEKKQNLN